jgi:hypothetical protein
MPFLAVRNSNQGGNESRDEFSSFPSAQSFVSTCLSPPSDLFTTDGCLLLFPTMGASLCGQICTSAGVANKVGRLICLVGERRCRYGKRIKGGRYSFIHILYSLCHCGYAPRCHQHSPCRCPCAWCAAASDSCYLRPLVLSVLTRAIYGQTRISQRRVSLHLYTSPNPPPLWPGPGFWGGCGVRGADSV